MLAKGLQLVEPAGTLLLTVSGLLAILGVLTIVGIWGFRLGSGKSDGNGGGGTKEPEPRPRPSPGGQQLDDAAERNAALDFAAWEAQLQAGDHDRAAPAHEEKAPSAAP